MTCMYDYDVQCFCDCSGCNRSDYYKKKENELREENDDAEQSNTNGKNNTRLGP